MTWWDEGRINMWTRIKKGVKLLLKIKIVKIKW